LPKIGRSQAVSSLADLQVKPQNCFQVVLDSDKAIPAYVANFFNTKLGIKIRESLSSGSTIPKISKAQLFKANIYLPDMETQAKTVHINSSISDRQTQLEILQRQLWNNPRNIKKIEKTVTSFTPENDFEIWVETLPFPLASVLWA
jgi:restriction endonuclease S subunit